MSDWTLHWLEASGDLAPWRDTIAFEVEEARCRVARIVSPPPLDILVRRAPGQVIPEFGIAGYAPDAHRVFLSVDPDNPNFADTLRGGALQRQVAHEVHHCLRWAGPGYGTTLGEALVSEGLAGQFASRLFGSPPEPWERAVTPAVAAMHFPSAADLASSTYDHSAWFFGVGGKYPRSLGYTLGYLIAGAWLCCVPDVDGETFVNVPAEEVLSSWART